MDIEPYNPHPSHDTVDVSDLSLVTDIACKNCELTDERLNKPCPGFDFKERRTVTVLIEVKRHRGWKTILKNTPSGIPLNIAFAKQWIINKQLKDKTNKYRVVRITEVKEVIK